jgi:hypothetical protein
MADNEDSLNSAASQLAEQLKIKASDPIFKIKLRLKKGLKKLNPFSALMQGKATKDETRQHMVKASSTGDYMVYRGKDPDKPDPYASEEKTLRNGMLVPNLPKNPFHVNCNPSNLSNY